MLVLAFQIIPNESSMPKLLKSLRRNDRLQQRLRTYKKGHNTSSSRETAAHGRTVYQWVAFVPLSATGNQAQVHDSYNMARQESAVARPTLCLVQA